MKQQLNQLNMDLQGPKVRELVKCHLRRPTTIFPERFRHIKEFLEDPRLHMKMQ